MLFTDKFTMTKETNTLDEYVYVAIKTKDDEYGLFVFHLKNVEKKGLFFKKFVGEYQIVAYAVSFDGHNTKILDMYPTAVRVMSLEDIKICGVLTGFDVRTPERYSTLTGGFFNMVTKSYKGVSMGHNVFYTDFKKKNKLIKKGA